MEIGKLEDGRTYLKISSSPADLIAASESLNISPPAESLSDLQNRLDPVKYQSIFGGDNLSGTLKVIYMRSPR